MAFAEDIVKLRSKIGEAITKGVVSDSGKETFEATLIQIMNEAEKSRQACANQAENLRRQAAIMDGQASAFVAVNSMVFNVVNSFVVLASRAEKEREMLEKERLEKEAAYQAAQASKEDQTEEVKQ